MGWEPPILTLELVFEIPVICQFSSGLGSRRGRCWGFSAPVCSDSLWLPVCLSRSGGSSLPCDLISLGNLRRSQKSYWFFSFFSFVLVRAEWQLPCPLHAGLETRTVCFYLWCSTQRTTEWYAQNKDIQGWILFLWNWILDLKRALEVNSFNLLFRCISRWYALLWTLLSQYSHILAE